MTRPLWSIVVLAITLPPSRVWAQERTWEGHWGDAPALVAVEGFRGRIIVGATVIYAPYSGTSLREATVTRLRERDGRVEIVVKQHNQRGTGSLLRYPGRVLVRAQAG